jgi:outer membrane protein TolC
VGIIGLCLTGCASLDATDDITAARAPIAQRTALDASWDAPWDTPGDLWDGQSPLSSDTATILALQNNRALRQQVQAIVAARADYVQAHLLPNPVLSLALGFPLDSGGGEPLAANAVMQLAWLWTRPQRIELADAGLRTQILQTSNAAITLVKQVRSQHANVTLAQRALQEQQEIVRFVQTSRDLVQRLYEAGEQSKLDLNRIEHDLLAAQDALRSRQAALDTAKRTLLETIGRADHPAQWQTDDVLIDLRLAKDDLTEDRLMQAGALLRLDVAAARAMLDAAQHQLELAKLGQVPDVGAGIGYQQNFASRPGLFPSVTVTPKAFDDNRAVIAKAQAQLEISRIEADRIRQQAWREVRTAWIDLTASMQRIEDYQQRMVALADENAALAQQAYTAGTIDLTALLQTQRAQAQARMQLIDLQQQAVGQYYELQRAAGGSLDPAFITRSIESTSPPDLLAVTPRPQGGTP